jgi:putative copper export protein
MLTDVLHLVMAAVWLGGLAGLSLVAWRLPQDSSKIASIQQLLRRFSNLALPLVVAVTVTGLLLAILRIGSWQALFQSGYGQTLLWKIGFFLLALVLAGVQRQVVLPYLQRQQDKPEANMLRVWQWSIRLELAMAILVFIIAGILSTTAPPAL